MHDEEELGERFGQLGRCLMVTIAIVAAAGGYLHYRRPQPPPAKTPQRNLAILRDHSAPQSARHRAAGELKSDSSAIPDLIDELEHGDDDGRFAAAMALGSMGERAGAATEAMVRAAEDTSLFVRRQVAASLPKISDDQELVASSLAPLLHDSDHETRGLAFESLLAQGEPGTRALIRLLGDPEADVRRRAVTALARAAGGDEVTQALRRAVGDEDEEVRTAALISLYQLEAVDFQELAGVVGEAKLLSAVHRLVWQVKADADPAVPFLRDALKSKDTETVSTAVEALRPIGSAARKASCGL